MPFPDETALTNVTIALYQSNWAVEGRDFAHQLRRLVPDAAAIEHIGSTSIPGMRAKDCLDMMVVVDDISSTSAGSALEAAGFRRRPEPWNVEEPAEGRLWPKMVFAPRVGARAVNIHVRPVDAPTTRRALLFRDFLSADTFHRDTWARFKTAAAAVTTELSSYGAIKDPAWLLLMEVAEQWAATTNWNPSYLSD
ncbi:GrpB family protein [Rudaeicoccus suwonensis]|uniref:GrpB-like predicted nucleotidyltransferase (UPF0157 family) n=1 Tax=Rudaeicoccus suwonensis TaxID=657409 RepID=A0A561E3S9_9MICO|nr:GrpB family protein [Rudaeicoccus suwonensis]TWE10268.1 GrpB-like predicted nucleotidyltransferase (UPF0157 family) [Rudaeicoccus suwonensis]